MGRCVSYADNSVHIQYAAMAEDGRDWDEFLDDFRAQIIAAFPGACRCDTWLGREDHALCDNRFAYFGISRFGCLISMWVTPKDSSCREKAGFVKERDRWISRIGIRFTKAARSCFGQPLVCAGQFSNGEGVFRAMHGKP